MSTPVAATPLRRALGVVARHPTLQAIVLLVVVTPVLVPIGEARLLLAAGALQIFTLVSPFLGFRHPHFWRYQLASLLSQFGAFLALTSLCEQLAPGHHVGDDMMIFFGPFATPIVLIPALILVRVLTRLGTPAAPTTALTTAENGAPLLPPAQPSA
jgi:hypothetical protein